MSKKEKKSQKEKKQKEVYVPKRGIMGNADDYHVYELTKRDKIIGFLIGGGGAAAVMFILFTNIIVSLIAFLVVGIKAVPIYQKFLLEKRKKQLVFQFKDMLESLTSSYSAGKNTRDAFIDTLNDLAGLYGNDADIVRECRMIVNGMDNNINVEELLLDFADRSEMEDVISFADVFEVSLRQGADLKTVIASTRDVIIDKIDIELDMQAMLASNKNEINVMMLMPLILSLSLRGMGDTYGNSFLTVLSKVIAIIIFGAAYAMGRKISDIKV